MSGRTLLQVAMSDFHSSNAKEKLVLIGLISHADPDGYNAFPGRGKLAAYAGCSVESVKRYLRRLRSSGVIVGYDSERRDKAIPKNRRPTAYFIDSSKFAQYASWEKEQGGHPDDPSEGGQNDSTSQSLGGHPDDPSRGVTQMTPNHPGNQSLSNNLSSPPLSLRSHDDGVTSFTEAQSARGDHRHNDEEIDQGREGEGDSTHFTDPDDFSQSEDASSFPVPEARFIETGELHASSITADTVPLSGHDVSSEQAREPSSEAHSSSGSNHPSPDAGSATGAHTAPEKVEYQDVDQKRAKHGWRPPENAYEHARAIAPDVNTELVITDYWLWCHKKGIEPDASHWMKWITREQKSYEDAVREQERKQAVEERRNRSWAKKNGWDL